MGMDVLARQVRPWAGRAMRSCCCRPARRRGRCWRRRAPRPTALLVVGLLGPAPEELAADCHLTLQLPEAPPERREEAELFLGHCLCGLIRQQLAGA
jgi:hypothetical protein